MTPGASSSRPEFDPRGTHGRRVATTGLHENVRVELTACEAVALADAVWGMHPTTDAARRALVKVNQAALRACVPAGLRHIGGGAR